MTKIAWITGASSGIGEQVARRLAAAGWQVAVSARSEQRLEALRQQSAAAGNITVFPLDVTDRAASCETVHSIETELGPLDLAFLNAGAYQPMPADAFDAELCARLMDVNYMGVVNALAALLPGMRGRDSGQILINASVAGYRGLPLACAYGPTKAALINLAESLRAELFASGLRVRVLNPGFVETPMTSRNRFRMPFLMTSEKAARTIVSRLDDERFEITFPWQMSYQLKLLRCLPYRLFFPAVRRFTGEASRSPSE